MYSFVLQDWITVGGASFTPVVQTEADWLDMSPFQDIVAWVDVRAVSGAPTPLLYLETAPAKDDVLFVQMAAAPLTLTVASTPTIVQLLMGSAAVPIAQYLRWRIQPLNAGSGWSATLRILVAANAPGLQPEDENRSLMMMGR